jgi:hypothetical protein
MCLAGQYKLVLRQNGDVREQRAKESVWIKGGDELQKNAECCIFIDTKSVYEIFFKSFSL